MIGVISKKEEAFAVGEFFELFKTPWEHYNPKSSYDVVISTLNRLPDSKVLLCIVYSSQKLSIDSSGMECYPQLTNSILEFGSSNLSLYGKHTVFPATPRPFLWTKDGRQIVGFELSQSGQLIYRIGYDLFYEVLFLLTEGQPVGRANMPSLETHISLLRFLILKAGIPFIEIPPVPFGYRFFVCVTHDVDFIKIGQHKFDHTFWGFLYRAVLLSFFNLFKGRLSLKKFFSNYKAVFSLPLIYLRLLPDFWFQFDKYIAIEKDLKSTFFIVPFKSWPGQKLVMPHPKRRSTRYDIHDIEDVVKKLLDEGNEIGVHGLDAWHNHELSFREMNEIKKMTSQSEIGIRMHWLCFDEYTPEILDRTGFSYDSSFGYNDGVGYRGGTTQVFRQPRVIKLLELPLHIQDVALFSQTSIESEAWKVCEELISYQEQYGGVLTILWHLRSIAPERLWGDFYIRLLDELRQREVQFATANQVVKWFQKRRLVEFRNVTFTGNKLFIIMDGNGLSTEAKMTIRIHLPSRNLSQPIESNHIDIPITGKTRMEINLNNYSSLEDTRCLEKDLIC